MILSTQLSTAGHPCTPYQIAKLVVKGVLQTLITVTEGLIELMKTFPNTLKINMAPKAGRYSGDKAEGNKTMRIGKDEGDSTGAVRCPISTAAKLSRKNTNSAVKDPKNDDVITPPMEVRGIGKAQPTIISYLAAEAQEKYTEHTLLPPENSQSEIKVVPLGTNREGAPVKMRVSQSDILDSGVGTKEKRDRSLIRGIGHSAHRSEITVERGAAGDLDDTTITTTTTTTLGTEGWQYVSSKSMAGDKEIERSLKHPDWAKDGGDTFYSVTEESDITSSEQDLNETGSSIRLTDVPIVNGQQIANNNSEGNACGLASSTCIASGESGMLQSIYNSIKELQTEARIESRCARVATKRLQGTVRKVAKSCTEIEAKLNTIEERTTVVEADVEALREQCVTQEGQLTDVMWKLEDHENRQRRNNLRFFGINEGVEGTDIRAYMIKLLRGAFPELVNWDWEIEIQHAHRVPVTRREGGHLAEPKYPRVV
ncbi:hypothetical protein NDU88_006353 [Pleurodeles waltl]|uniref:Uncharacterized protein n=1 Tax=Pleurodeles waltl TaxID=8319 RepID=A0AAV7MBZ5_PLEWA|nr:hypothetical protein NDU88_006353 [Pleurodeles waltl]